MKVVEFSRNHILNFDLFQYPHNGSSLSGTPFPGALTPLSCSSAPKTYLWILGSGSIPLVSHVVSHCIFSVTVFSVYGGSSRHYSVVRVSLFNEEAGLIPSAVTEKKRTEAVV